MTTTAASIFRHIIEALTIMSRGAPEPEASLRPGSGFVLTGHPLPGPNTALLSGGGVELETLRDFAERTRIRGLPCVLYVWPELVDEVAPVAHELGFSSSPTMPLMVFEPDAEVPQHDAADVEIFTGANAHADFIQLATAFGVSPEIRRQYFGLDMLDGPGIEIFSARYQGQPVSTVTTVRGGSTVGIWIMGTPPEHQRKGFGYALLSAAINQYRARGVRQFYLISTAAGQPLYRKIGFQPIAELAVWRRERPT
jgi:GNAT superfamily N-acetyltransferase